MINKNLQNHSTEYVYEKIKNLQNHSTEYVYEK